VSVVSAGRGGAVTPDQQLAFGLEGAELGQTVDLPDIDPAKADAEHRALVEAILAASRRPEPCQCDRPLVLNEPRCAKCGRAP